MAESKKKYNDIGTLWRNTAKNGNEYLRGKVTFPNGATITIVCFPFTTPQGNQGYSVLPATPKNEEED